MGPLSLLSRQPAETRQQQLARLTGQQTEWQAQSDSDIADEDERRKRLAVDIDKTHKEVSVLVPEEFADDGQLIGLAMGAAWQALKESGTMLDPTGIMLTISLIQTARGGIRIVMSWVEAKQEKSNTETERPCTSMAEWMKSSACRQLMEEQDRIEQKLGDDKFMTREKAQPSMHALARMQGQVAHPFPEKIDDPEVRHRVKRSRGNIWKMRMPPITYKNGKTLIQDLRDYWNMDIAVSPEAAKLLETEEAIAVPPMPNNTPVAVLNMLCERLQLTVKLGNGGRMMLEPAKGTPGTLMENPYAYWVHRTGEEFDTVEVTLKNGEPLLHIDPKSYGQLSRRGLRVDSTTKSPEFPLDKRPDGRKTRIDFAGVQSADTGDSQELFLHIVTVAQLNEALVPLKDEATIGMQHLYLYNSEEGVYEMNIGIRYPEAWATTRWDEESCLQAMALPNEYTYVYADGTREPATVKSVCQLSANCHDLKVTFHPPKLLTKTVKAMHVKGYGALGEYDLPLDVPDTPGMGTREPLAAPATTPPRVPVAPAPFEDPIPAPGFPDLIRKAGRWIRGKMMPGKPEDLPPPRPPLKAD